MAISYSPKIKNNNLDYYIDFSNKKSYSTNILNYSSWTIGTGSISESLSLYGSSGFIQNGTSDENIREIGLDPFGNDTVLWSARNNDVVSNSDGGFNTSTYPIDNTKMYRFSVWINREVLGNGEFYFGLYSNDSEFNEVYLKTKLTGLTYSTTVNPYFARQVNTVNIDPPYFGGLNTWTLLVGHLWPIDSATGSNHVDSGLYTRELGKISDLYGGGVEGDFIQVPESVYVRHRSYLFYSTDPTTVQKWCYPRIDLCDGTEPSIQDLLTSSDPIKDLSRNGITASFKYNSGLTSDKAMVFNGTNSITTSYIPTSTDSTFEVWCKLTEDLNSFNMVFGLTLPYLSFKSLSSVTSPGNFLYSTRIGGIQQNLYGTQSWELNKVYHIACTTEYVGTQSSVKIFVNGVLDNQGLYDGFYDNPSNYKILIGDGRTPTWYPFKGDVYSFKIYREALLESDILQNFNAHKSKFGY